MPKFNVGLNQVEEDLKSAVINCSTNGNNTLIVGVAGQIIRVFKIYFVVTTAVSVKFRDGASTDLSGAMALAANGALVFDFDTKPWVLTSVGNDLVLNLSSGVQTSGAVFFTQA